MNEEVFRGCQDCYDVESPLQVCPKDLLLDGVVAQLCISCITNRKEDLAANRSPRQVGIPADDVGMNWIDQGASVKYNDGIGHEHEAIVRYQEPVVRQATGMIGRVRFRLVGNLRWFPAAELSFVSTIILNDPTGYALNSAMNAIRHITPRMKVLLVRRKKDVGA